MTEWATLIMFQQFLRFRHKWISGHCRAGDEREKRMIRRHLRQVATQTSDEGEEMITQSTSNQHFAQDNEIGNDELPSCKEEEATIQSCNGEQDEAEFGSECLAEAESEGWIRSSNEEEQNSASAVVHVHVRECEGVHQMQNWGITIQ